MRKLKGGEMGEYENRELNVGNLGEGVFSIWCTTARLSANRSLDEDSTGWDHIVRFPYEKRVSGLNG